MKKIFALALAAVMTAGMTTVAFAAPEGEGVYVGATNTGAVTNSDEGWIFVLDDNDRATTTLAKYNGVLKGGDEIAIPIVYQDEDGATSWYTLDTDYSKADAYADWDIGDADVEIRLIRYANFNDEIEGRVYSAVITLPENDSKNMDDLVGTVAVGRTRTTAKNSTDTVELDISYAPDGVDYTIRDKFDGGVLDSGDTGIVAFDSDAGEIEIEFEETALFEVDVTGQGRQNLAWNTDFDSEVADLDKSANMDFVTFEGNPSFNKNGTMYIYADADTYLYQVVDGKLKAVDAEYDEDYEAWTFKTRSLGAYVISDKELDLDEINTELDDKDDASSTTDGDDKPNPDTGR